MTDAARFKPYLTGLAEIAVARRLAPRGFAWRRPPYEFEKRLLPIDILCGTDRIRTAIERGHRSPRSSARGSTTSIAGSAAALATCCTRA